MIVADTNLIAYLMIRSEATPSAEAVLRRDPLWAAPLLWRSEFRNVLALYVRKGVLSVPDAVLYMDAAEELLAGREYQVPTAPVLQLSQASGCSAYDCEFVQVAQELDTVLVTSDQKVLEAFPGRARSMEAFAGTGGS